MVPLSTVGAGTRFQFMRDGAVWVGHGGGAYGTEAAGQTPSHRLERDVVVLLVGVSAG